MWDIKVLDGNLKQIRVIERDHNRKNIEAVAKWFVKEMGEIVKSDHNSDCLSIVTYEKGVLGFSI
jgi:hypothetical protein